MTLSIDKGVPVPPILQPSTSIYPFEAMQVGDSFFVQTKDAAQRIRKRQAVSQAAVKFRKQSDSPALRFTTRQVRNGVRCWRIA